MPLSEPAPREPLHQRQVKCRGYKRVDGLWDIEGHLIDTKNYDFESRERGRVRAGVPVHEMWIRLTIDADLTIHHAEAATDFSPYRVCPAITDDFRELAGITIGPGWTRLVMQRVGGVKGCTHLVELLRPVATTAYQTLVRERARKRHDPDHRPRHLDSCHALATDGMVVKLDWPAFYTGSGDS